MDKLSIITLYLLLSVFSSFAQTTRTSLSGFISDLGNKPVPGATVQLTHIPTGTIYGSASNTAGKFFIPNIKSGGPYQIDISSLNYKNYILRQVYFRLGEEQDLRIVLEEVQNQLLEVQITDSVSSAIQTYRTGPAKHIDDRLIRSLPSIKRGISDFVRLVPQSFGPAIAGGNYRQNFITIDGSEFNNTFGVGENLPGNGAQPISLDAIDEISIQVAPFNEIWQSGFIGSAINITTYSGKNDVSFSGYSYFRNENDYGYKAGNNSFEKKDLSYRMYGFRLGGPILKNKLFYFINAERENELYPPQQLRAATVSNPYGSGSNITRPTASELDDIRKYLVDKYNYQAGPFENYQFNNKSLKFLTRIDWNIAANTSLSVRYNQLNSTRPELVNGSRSPLPPFPTSFGRRDRNALAYSNSNFYTQSNFYSLAAELDTKIAALSNTVRASYTQQYEPRRSNSKIFPFVDILKDGQPFTSFGYEPFTYGNRRDVKVLSLTDYVEWVAGKSNWLSGIQIDHIRTKNSYIPFGTGYYTFESWNDFISGAKPLDFAITYSLIPDKKNAVYSFDYLNTAAFVQNTFSINDRIKFTAGLRFDLPIFPKPLIENPLLATLRFSKDQQIHTSQLPKPDMLISPRIGILYNLDERKIWRLRGGTGIFTGRIPFVWIISQARYSGMFQLTQTWQGKENTPGGFKPEADAYIPVRLPASGEAIPTIVSALSRNLKMPQTWKSSIGLDVRLPFNLTGTFEALFNKDINSVIFRDVNLVDPQPLNIAGYPDNRTVYPSNPKDRYLNMLNDSGKPDGSGSHPFNAVVLSNSSKGYYLSMMLGLARQLQSNFSFSAAYTINVAKTINDGDGDQTLSALYSTATVNGINNTGAGYSGYISPHRIITSISYSKQYTKYLKFNAGLTYQGAVDGRFSYTYLQDLVRDGTNKSLIYVPKDPSEITFVALTKTSGERTITYSAEEQSAAFFAYVNQDRYLRTRKGKYAERNGAKFPWRNQVDLKISNDILLGVKRKNTIQLSLDIFNVGNLLNRNWGLKKLVNASSILNPTNLNQIVPGGFTIPMFQIATVGEKMISSTFRNDVSLNSTYSMQFGIRYLF